MPRFWSSALLSMPCPGSSRRAMRQAVRWFALGHQCADIQIYGTVDHMVYNTTRAILLFHEKVVLADGAIVELIIWRLPRATPDRHHGLKYRLYFGRGRKWLVRYDNETGKGDHRNIKDREEPC